MAIKELLIPLLTHLSFRQTVPLNHLHVVSDVGCCRYIYQCRCLLLPDRLHKPVRKMLLTFTFVGWVLAGFTVIYIFYILWKGCIKVLLENLTFQRLSTVNIFGWISLHFVLPSKLRQFSVYIRYILIWEEVTRVGILKQNAKSWYSGIPGFKVRRNSKKFFLPNYFFKTLLSASIVYVIYTACVA